MKELLDNRYKLYNNKAFIENDPIQIPHLFTDKKDIEISAFLVSTIAWGNRNSIIKNGCCLLERMDNKPYAFICGFTDKDLKPFTSFIHRTFNGDDCIFFLKSLRKIYKTYPDLEALFYEGYTIDKSIKQSLVHFRNIFFALPHLKRTEKHLPDTLKNSAAKRLNMFLRWMVRKDQSQIDFGIWKKIPASALYLPLDVHTGRTARKLNLLQRKQDDWKAVEEVTRNLRILDKHDPVKYDIALFGMGRYETI